MPETKIDRDGSEYGKFVSPEGTPFPMRGLPDEVLKSSKYKVYKVFKPIEVESVYIARWFGQPGLGIQHKLPLKVKTLIKKGFIKEVK